MAVRPRRVPGGRWAVLLLSRRLPAGRSGPGSRHCVCGGVGDACETSGAASGFREHCHAATPCPPNLVPTNLPRSCTRSTSLTSPSSLCRPAPPSSPRGARPRRVAATATSPCGRSPASPPSWSCLRRRRPRTRGQRCSSLTGALRAVSSCVVHADRPRSSYPCMTLPVPFPTIPQ